ncbi:sensor histidine kinase [Algibacillus agarilyticus]|uniref:sensor histidine kinase n=1 Tax=Algibacillus agarilyticus TaxID=2234133 RepID=UPI000DD060B8|nr:ATP-binding protein [Algibacillus agarilyticus]
MFDCNLNAEQNPVDLAVEAYQGELASLRTQASSLTHLVKVLPAGVVIIDGSGLVRDANQIAIDFLGTPLKGQRWLTIIERAFAPQADDGHEVSLKDGRRVKLQTTDLSPESGQLVLLTDMTETRLLQSRVAKLKHLSALGKMMATLAHQIRTPLSAAMLYAANLGNSSLKPNSRISFQQKLISRLQDLEKQITDMLLFAKGDQDHVAQKISLQQLLSEVQIGSEAMLTQCAGRLEAQLPEPDIIILGNKNALASAIQNLIHNSIQVIGEGVMITLSASRDINSPNEVCICVQDNGPGIDAAHHAHIFEPFYTTRSQGTGLGLAVVKSVIEQHKGRVEIESTSGQGAKFILKLPIVETLNHTFTLAQVSGQN